MAERTAALDRGRDLLEPALRSAIDSLPGAMRHIAGYHFGWWNVNGEPPVGEVRRGKALRPALVLLAAEAVGGAATAAMPAAVAVELVHNFSLIQDDVMDQDVTRRHRPTVWTIFGPGAAILAGDALLTLAFDVLAVSRHDAVAQGAKMLNSAVVELLEGQAEDLAFEERDDVTLAEVLLMARHKTAALLECSGGLGALFGGGSAGQITRLEAFSADLGLAFQVTDDYLGIWGDPAQTGKPAFSDLRSRKKTLPVVAALSSGTEAGEQLAAVYGSSQEPSDTEPAELARLIDAAGGRLWCVHKADALAERAISHLSGDVIRYRSELAGLARLAATRER